MIDLKQAASFVEEHIGSFHESRIRRLRELNLETLLKRKNPYLFRAKNLLVSADLVRELLMSHLSSSEEELFGRFLEEFAIFVNGLAFNGQKATSQGIDLDFRRKRVRYLVSIKSGINWGNSSQIRKQWEDFHLAVKVVRQNRHEAQVQAVEGVCYGRRKTTMKDQVLRITGQAFWELITGDNEFYKVMIEPLGHNARKHNESFQEQLAVVTNKFTGEFSDQFCVEGKIDWGRLVEFNSGQLVTSNPTMRKEKAGKPRVKHASS